MGNKIAILAALPQEADAFMVGKGEVLTNAPFAIRNIGDIVIATCGIGAYLQDNYKFFHS
jgi:hypothetical protein